MFVLKARKGVPPKPSTVSMYHCDRYALSDDTSERSKCLAVLFTGGTKEYEAWTGGRLLVHVLNLWWRRRFSSRSVS